MPSQPAFRKEIRRKLNGATKARSYHGRTNTTVDALDAFAPIDSTQSIDGVFVVVLGPNGQERRIRLQASLHEEERRSSRRPDDAGSCTGKDVDAERLHVRVTVDGIRHCGAKRFVEAETATIEENLVDILQEY